jgi:head-tail adaptor
MTIKRGEREHLVSLQNPTGAPDADGSFTQTWAALDPPTLWVSIKPATARDLERTAAGTVTSMASHILEGDYHAGVTTATRVLFGSRVFSVVGVQNVEERSIDMALVCVEVVP